MIATLRAIGATMRAAFAEAISNRSAFWSQVGAMILNDLGWVAFWVLFFNRVGRVRGWDSSRVLLLLAILATSAGLVLGLLSNARRIGNMAADGDLDAVLALPVPPLAYLLVRRIDPVNLGDTIFGVILFLTLGTPTPARVTVFVAGTLASAMVLTGFLVASGSLAFFIGRSETSDVGLHAILILASYPADIFRGAPKLLLYTVVPAAFVSAVPTQLVDHFDPVDALLLGGVAGLAAALGWGTFTLGLRRYTSGAVWTRA